ncbi:hypothetical protein [Pedobacter nutrimenti]|uniref:hypothetical protein n=1 Tax=Pedobacter nutrimenti TaxID=1241337 RepID=UPI00292D85F6|nr:hypothetical protein [Pedobacter nutrimenti]
MKILNKIVCNSLLILGLMISGCSNHDSVRLSKQRIHLSNFKKAILGTGITTDISIIKTYANEDPCTANELNSNLYICKSYENNDTLYVFDVCGKVPYFAKKKVDATIVIDHEKIKSNIPQEIIIKVPETFSIPKNSKYVVSSLTSLEY